MTSTISVSFGYIFKHVILMKLLKFLSLPRRIFGVSRERFKCKVELQKCIKNDAVALKTQRFIAKIEK